MKGTYEVEMSFDELKALALREALADYCAGEYMPKQEVIRAFKEAINSCENKKVEGGQDGEI